MSTILAVDDSVMNLKAIKYLLSEKHRVVAVRSAAEALDYLKNQMPDLILLDILMPEMDGFAMMEILKADDRLKNIPVIFLSADDDKANEQKGYGMGAVDFIRKPFEPESTLERINKAISAEG